MKNDILSHFSIDGDLLDFNEFGHGHINNTFLAHFNVGGKSVSITLQEINTTVFKNPDMLMQNLYRVTEHLKKKITEHGGNTARETLNFIPTDDGKLYYRHSDNSCWRAYYFIDGVESRDTAESAEEFYQSAVAFGNFQKMLSDFDAGNLYEIIPDFHNTPKRFEDLCIAIDKNIMGRKEKCKDLIEFINGRKNEMNSITKQLDSGNLPLRVTHNDTKLNNILIDSLTKKAVCIIDLDTVMPGSSLYDFGDSIRFGANTALEDEKDWAKVHIDTQLYEAYVRGYTDGCGKCLTPLEKSMMPIGAKLITLECAMRFLTDYLNGDTYFKTAYDEHNLVRSKAQLALVNDMEKNWDMLCKISDEY